MFTKLNYDGPLLAQYETISKQLDALLDGETDQIANLSNASALLNQFLTDINWVGFYLMKDNELVLDIVELLARNLSASIEVKDV